MSDLDDSFLKLLGRKPTDFEQQNLFKIGDALGIKKNDAFWLILIALQSHQTLYSEIPGQIEVAAKEILNEINEAANLAMSASAVKAHSALSEAVAMSANKIANNTARKEKVKWIALCIATSTICIGVLIWKVHAIAHESGYSFGYAVGYEKAANEKAAANWANTPQGQSAYKLAQKNELDSLIHCSKPGWTIENGNCFPKNGRDGLVYGWKLP